MKVKQINKNRHSIPLLSIEMQKSCYNVVGSVKEENNNCVNK